MATLNDFPVKADGSFPEGAYWDRTIGEELARINGIWPLTADHWKVIDFVRKYYLELALAPRPIKSTGPRVSDFSASLSFSPGPLRGMLMA